MMGFYSVTSSYTVAANGDDRVYTDVVIAPSPAAARDYALDRYSSSKRDDLTVKVVPFVGDLDVRIVATLSVDADDNPVFVGA